MEQPKNRTVIYQFNHSRMGFQNEITHFSISDDHALRHAMDEVEKAYGKRMFKKFTFKIKP